MTHLKPHYLAPAALLLFCPGLSMAQVVKKPNIMFIIDTSGSMEYETGADTFPTCYTDGSDPAYPNEPNSAFHTKSRWIQVLETLTGSIDSAGYACAAERRDTSNFIDEFQVRSSTTVDPPDAYYRNPYHRPLSYGCAITPFRPTAPTLANPFDWEQPVEYAWPVDTTLPVACTTGFTQQPNGFIDTYTDLARFGLMTFDPLPHEGTGHSDTAPYASNETDGVLGGWSYYFGSPAEGKPVDCKTGNEILEVGVRNAAAPASEGKMIYFGDQDLSSSLDNDRHTRLKQVLLATRPYGATPLNGALHDARAFFWEDDGNEPLGESTGAPTMYGTATTKLSPKSDEYVLCGCREQHIVLITDGEPNLDMRPECAAVSTSGNTSDNGVCPYIQTPAQILADLSSDTKGTTACAPDNKLPILTHVVGFSTATFDGGAKNCADLKTIDPSWDTNSCVNPTDDDLRVCCTLHQLAEAGGTNDPYIAPDGSTLSTALGDIMAEILEVGGTRTRPVRSPGVGRGESKDRMVAFRLLTSYTQTTSSSENVWRGHLERLRWTCDTSNVPTEQPKSESLGDDFTSTLNQNADSRTFVTFRPATGSARRSLRPFFGGTDEGVGTVGGTQVSGNAAALKGGLAATVLEVDHTADAACLDASPASSSDAGCKDRVLDWTLGETDDRGMNRCASSSDPDCSVMGDIFSSTPTIVDRPVATVEDETYEGFATTYAGRMMTAYVSSNDGMLHAFGVSSNDPADLSLGTDGIHNSNATSEQFAFIPPAVLPLLKSQYRTNRLMLLDGEAVTMDVVARYDSTLNRYELGRFASAADGATNTWRTILVQGFGGGQTGYFALDITDPTDPTFLWQLTTTSNGNNLFGSGGVPLITTVSVKRPADTELEEVAVAVLPGGAGESPIGGTCDRKNPDRAAAEPDDTHFDATITAGYPIRTQVNCYANSATNRAARSLTIVRLDSGEILRRFVFEPGNNLLAPDVDLLPSVFSPDFSSASVASPTPPFLDSPITGAPSAYPAGPGMISDRIFVGDQDGTMWRVDLSLQDPQDWKMDLFFDGYTNQLPGDGKPIKVAPTLSVNERGQITVAFGTGDQDTIGAATDKQYVWSLTEVEGSGKYAARVNWYETLSDGTGSGPQGFGEHLLGPIELQGGVLYFATVVPPGSSDPCQRPSGRIWGLDYERADGTASGGGEPALEVQGSTPPIQPYTNVSSPAFGVSLEYVPSCSTAAAGETDYLGSSRTSVTTPSPTQLQLVYQTTEGGDTGSGLGFTTGFEAIALEPPRTASTILSWAAILD